MTQQITNAQVESHWPVRLSDGSIGTVQPAGWGTDTLWFVSSEGRGEGPVRRCEAEPY